MVILVGAGPGAKDLITVRGLNALRRAQCVIYDRLISDDILNEVPEGAEMIYVGKEPGKHYASQQEINDLLITYGRKYERVVRLKGGDPFVFGRGGEEVLALNEAGIHFEVIPGLTSAIAVPETAGIPVTHRGMARSFHVVTGHTMDGINDMEDVYARLKILAGEEGTLVFLMGSRNLRFIAGTLVNFGKDRQTPAAVIHDGTLGSEKKLVGDLGSIADIAENEGVGSPSIIVIGDVVNVLCSYKKRVAVVGTCDTLNKLRRALNGCGIGTVPMMDMAVKRLPDAEKLLQIFKEADKYSEKRKFPYDWVLFTSRQAVKLFFQIFNESGADIRTLSDLKFGCIAEGTADELKKYHIACDFMSSHPDSDHFAGEFTEHICRGQKVLIPHAYTGSKSIVYALEKAGIYHTELLIYDVEGRAAADFENIIRHEKSFVFLSASGARAFFAELNDKNAADVFYGEVNIFCIGKFTEDEFVREYKSLKGDASGFALIETSEAYTLKISENVNLITADKYTVSGLCDCMHDFFNKE